MKIYKKTIIILIAILSVIFLSISFSKPVQAARWHRSVPTAVRGNYHNAKLKITVQIQKKNVYYMPDNGAAVSPAKRIYSRKLRKNVYQYKRDSFKSPTITFKFGYKNGRKYLRVHGATSILDKYTYWKVK